MLLEDVVAIGADEAEIAAVGAVPEAGGMAGTGLAVQSLEVGTCQRDDADLAAVRAFAGVGRVMFGD